MEAALVLSCDYRLVNSAKPLAAVFAELSSSLRVSKTDFGATSEKQLDSCTLAVLTTQHCSQAK